MNYQVHNLLVVDWDFFFPDKFGDPNTAVREWMLWDWGHAEDKFYIDILWPGRAAGFISNGLELPGLSGEQVDFWSRFRFMPDAKLYFHESNASAASTSLVGPEDWYRSVWLYDAHHDSGYCRPGQTLHKLVKRGVWTCEDWMVLYDAIRAKLHVRYPKWKAWAFQDEARTLIPAKRLDRQHDSELENGPVGIAFDRVFVCRSGAWVPPWHDEAFEQFLAASPVQDQTCLMPDGVLPRRDFSMEQVQLEIEQRADAMRRFEEAQKVSA